MRSLKGKNEDRQKGWMKVVQEGTSMGEYRAKRGQL